MKKEEQELKKMLLRQSPSPNPSRKQETIRLVQQAFDRASVNTRIPFWKRVKTQLAYTSPSLWIGQAVLLGFFIWIVRTDTTQGIGLNQLFALFAPLVGLIGIPELGKSYSTGIWELEQSCRYNLKQLMIYKLMIIGFGDLLVLGVFTAVCGTVRSEPLIATAIYLLVPFNLSCAAYLALFQQMRSRFANYLFVGVAALLVAAMAYLNKIPSLYQAGAFWIWGLMFLISTVLFFVQLYSLLGRYSPDDTPLRQK